MIDRDACNNRHPDLFLLFAEYNEHVLKRVVRMTTTSIHHLVRVISLRFPVLRTMQAWVVVYIGI